MPKLRFGMDLQCLVCRSTFRIQPPDNRGVDRLTMDQFVHQHEASCMPKNGERIKTREPQ